MFVRVSYLCKEYKEEEFHIIIEIYMHLLLEEHNPAHIVEIPKCTMCMCFVYGVQL